MSALCFRDEVKNVLDYTKPVSALDSIMSQVSDIRSDMQTQFAIEKLIKSKAAVPKLLSKNATVTEIPVPVVVLRRLAQPRVGVATAAPMDIHLFRRLAWQWDEEELSQFVDNITYRYAQHVYRTAAVAQEQVR